MPAARPPSGAVGAGTGMAAGPPASPSAVAPGTASGRQALALLLRVAAPLLARGLDLGQVQLVVGPLNADLLADELLDGLEQERARLVGQADGLAGGAGTRRAADAVDVVLGILRQVPVDDVAHALDVQPPRGDVRRDEDGQRAVLEVVQELEPLLLIHVPGERPRLPAVPGEAVLEAPRLLPRVGEDEDAAAPLALV